MDYACLSKNSVVIAVRLPTSRDVRFGNKNCWTILLVNFISCLILMTCSTRYIVNIVVDCKHQVRNKGATGLLPLPRFSKAFLVVWYNNRLPSNFPPFEKIRWLRSWNKCCQRCFFYGGELTWYVGKSSHSCDRMLLTKKNFKLKTPMMSEAYETKNKMLYQ